MRSCANCVPFSVVDFDGDPFHVPDTVFVYYAWEITGMRSGSDERTSSLVSPCLARSKRDLGTASETLAWLASPAKI